VQPRQEVQLELLVQAPQVQCDSKFQAQFSLFESSQAFMGFGQVLFSIDVLAPLKPPPLVVAAPDMPKPVAPYK
jgi:hypothetical protein